MSSPPELDKQSNPSASPRPPARRPKVGTYACVPQEILTATMLAKVSGAAKSVAMAVMQWQWEYKRDDGRAKPISLEELADMTGLSKRSVINAIHELERAGLLQVERGRGRNHFSYYALQVPEKVNSSSPFNEEEGEQAEPDSSPFIGEKVNESVGKGEHAEFTEVFPPTTPLYKQHETPRRSTPTQDEALRHEAGQSEGFDGSQRRDDPLRQQGKGHDEGASMSKAEESKYRDLMQGIRMALPKGVASLLMEARVVGANGTFDIEFRYDSHREMLASGSNFEALAAAVRQEYGDVPLVLKTKPRSRWKPYYGEEVEA